MLSYTFLHYVIDTFSKFFKINTSFSKFIFSTFVKVFGV